MPEQCNAECQQWRKDVDEALRLLVRQLPEEMRIPALEPWLKEKMPQAKELAGLTAPHEDSVRLREITQQLKQQTAKNADLQQQLQQAAERLRATEANLVAMKADAQKLQHALDEALQHAAKDEMPALTEKILSGLSAPLQVLVEKYFNTQPVHTFFVQCGQFTRLVQFWEACKRAVLEQGAPPLDMCDFLRRLLSLYNAATPQGQAEAIWIEPGTPFDFDVAQRVGADGMCVQTLVLPGLRNPAGKVLHKALVSLS